MPRPQPITLTPIIRDTIHTVTIPDIIHIVIIPDTVLIVPIPDTILIVTIPEAIAHMDIQAHILLTQEPMDIIQVLTVTVVMAHIMGVLTVAPMEVIMGVLTATTAAAPMEAMAVLTEAIADYMEFLLTAIFMEAYIQAVHTLPDYTAAV